MLVTLFTLFSTDKLQCASSCLFAASHDPVDPLGLAAVTGIYSREDVPVEQTGYCMTWGQHHYRTLDGKMYRFQGDCSYVLLEDIDHFITVHLHNQKGCSGLGCKR